MRKTGGAFGGGEPKLSKSLGLITDSSSTTRSAYFVIEGGGGSASMMRLTFLLTLVGVRFGVLVQPYLFFDAGDLKRRARRWLGPGSGFRRRHVGGGLHGLPLSYDSAERYMLF